MPAKRPIEVRIAEHDAKGEDLRLEKAVKDLKERAAARKASNRSRRRRR